MTARSDGIDPMRVAAAVSGGVDSSVAAALLVDEGHEVVALHMRIDGSDVPAHPRVTDGAGSAVSPPEAVCQALGLPLHLVDLTEEFQSQVLAPFLTEYRQGRTPNPCILCNRRLKFSALWEVARSLGAQRLATGHYARIAPSPDGRFHLLRGRDRDKDQSYFLFSIDRAMLERLVFPLGNWTKDRVQALARDRGLPCVESPASQDLCFLGGLDYLRYIEARLAPDQLRPGPIVHALTGEVLGVHDGIHRFTIGQRRGLKVGGRAGPLYVVELEAEAGRVLVGPKEALLCSECTLTRCSWLNQDASGRALDGQVQIRYRHAPVPARVEPMGRDGARVVFQQPEPAVTPGQAAVVYLDDEVLGGGWIHTRKRS